MPYRASLRRLQGTVGRCGVQSTRSCGCSPGGAGSDRTQVDETNRPDEFKQPSALYHSR